MKIIVTATKKLKHKIITNVTDWIKSKQDMKKNKESRQKENQNQKHT